MARTTWSAIASRSSESLSSYRETSRLPTFSVPMTLPLDLRGTESAERSPVRRRRHGAWDGQHLEPTFDGIEKHERHAIVGNHAAQRAGDRREEGLPVEAGHECVIHPQENSPALFGTAQLAGSVLHEALKVVAELSQLPGHSPRRYFGHDG